MSENQGLIASHISVTRDDGHILVDDVSIHAEAGRTLVIVGESGAGKSMLARTICALTPHTLSAQGQVTLGGREFDIVRQARAFKALRGKGIDLALAREYGDEVVVMRHGKVVESGSVEKVFTHPENDYTRQLAAAEPRLDGPNPRSFTEESQAGHSSDVASEKNDGTPALVDARDLVKVFRGRSRRDRS